MNTFISVQTFLESTKKNKYIDYSPLIKGVFRFQIEKVDDDLKKYNLFIEDEKTKNKIILKTKLKPNIKDLDNKSVIIAGELINNQEIPVLEIDDIFLEKKFSKNNLQKQISPNILKVAKKVAVVTSKKGKVWGDIKNQFNADEWFSQNVKFELHHTSTQGDNAVYEICEMIEKINTNKLADIILLARGGGDSKLRNAVFNDKDLIEYISKTMIPIIAGIGHNDDITFTDLMVHESCSTPTAAAVKIINSVKPEKKVNNDLDFQKKLDQLDKIIDKIDKKKIIEKELETNNPNINNNVIDENKKRHSQELLNKKTVSSDDILKLILNIKDSKFYIGFCNKSNLKVYEEVLKLLEKQEEERNFLFSKDNIPLNPYLIVKLINDYNFQIYLLNKEDIESNINTEKEIIYINETHLSEKIDFYFIDEFKTNYNFYQKTLFINKNDVINDLS